MPGEAGEREVRSWVLRKTLDGKEPGRPLSGYFIQRGRMSAIELDLATSTEVQTMRQGVMPREVADGGKRLSDE